MSGNERTKTVKDVAARAGVSLGTVSNYINGTKNVSSRTARRIDQAIAEMRFVPNRAVRSLRGNRTRAIGLLVADSTNPFFTELARGVENFARGRGYVVVYSDTGGDPERLRSDAQILAEMRIGGAIIASTSELVPELAGLDSLHTPIVILGGKSPSPAVSTVNFDHRRAGYLAMQHLLDLGHTDILFAGGPGGDAVLRERYRGAQDAASGSDAVLRRVDAGGSTVAERSALGELILGLDPRPTGLICGNDVIAIAILNRLIRSGLSIPRDLSIVGHDDIGEAQLAVTPLTTIRQPAYEIGETATQLLFDRSDHPDGPAEHASFAPEFILRDSTARPAQA